MNVRVELYAACRDVFSASHLDVEMPAGRSASDLLDLLEARAPAFARIRPALKLAVNDEMAASDLALVDGDVVALLPPVSGGVG